MCGLLQQLRRVRFNLLHLGTNGKSILLSQVHFDKLCFVLFYDNMIQLYSKLIVLMVLKLDEEE